MADETPRLVIDLAHLFWAAMHARASMDTAPPVEQAARRVAELAEGWPRERVALAIDAPPYVRADRSPCRACGARKGECSGHDFEPSYKAHRVKDPDAVEALRALYRRLRAEGWRLVLVPGHEADDVVASMVAQDRESPITVVTGDKDLWCLLAFDHVTLLDSRTGEIVTPDRVKERWDVEPTILPDLLALAGDASDGIAGVPKVGPKTAASLLSWGGSLSEILALDTPDADALAAAKRDADRAAKRAKAGEDGPEAETLAALAAQAKRHATALSLVARVHEHRAAVELARELVALRYDLELPEHGAGVVATGGHERHAAHTPGADVAPASYEDEERAAIQAESRGEYAGADLSALGGGDETPPTSAAGMGPAVEAAQVVNEERETMYADQQDEITVTETANRGGVLAHPSAPLARRDDVPIAPLQPAKSLLAPLPELPPPPAVRDGISTRFRQSAKVGALMVALAKAQGEFDPATRDAENPHLRRKYADLASVMRAVRLPLAKHGLALVQPVVDGCLITRLHHGDEWIESEIRIALDSTQGRTQIQALGSSLTYLRRYAIMALLGVAADDDDDGESDGRGRAAPMGQRRSA